MANFLSLVEAVKAWPYSKSFKLSDVYSGWDTLSNADQKELLRQFAAYATDNHFSVRIVDDEENHLSDLNFSYEKHLWNEIESGAFTKAVEMALMLKALPSGREVILPELQREKSNCCSFLDTGEGIEKALDDMIHEGSIPFVKKIGEAHGFSVYKRL